MIGIIGAMQLETTAICEVLTEKQRCEYAGMTFLSGKLNGIDVVVSTCGPGKVFAAVCAQTMILKFHPSYLINIGVGGAISPSLHVTDLAVATSTVQHDMDTSPLGDPKGMISQINRIHLPCDPTLIQAARDAMADLGLKGEFGVIATGDQFVDSAELKSTLQSRFGAIACDMEGGAIGHVCFINQVPYIVLRAISDNAEDGAPVSFETFAVAAAAQSVKLLTCMLKKL